jgi:hypothetical protein
MNIENKMKHLASTLRESDPKSFSYLTLYQGVASTTEENYYSDLSRLLKEDGFINNPKDWKYQLIKGSASIKQSNGNFIITNGEKDISFPMNDIVDYVNKNTKYNKNDWQYWIIMSYLVEFKRFLLFEFSKKLVTAK